jgi:hypothetical protein
MWWRRVKSVSNLLAGNQITIVQSVDNYLTAWPTLSHFITEVCALAMFHIELFRGKFCFFVLEYERIPRHGLS